MPYSISMHRSQLPRCGMSLGGIGAGCFEIRQDGGFANWSLFNNWPLFTGPRYPYNPKQTLFFMLWIQPENENPRIVLLQIEDSHGSGGIEKHEFHYMFPWLSGVDVIRTSASFPFADLDFEQEGLPVRVSLRAWSPFIPGNVKDSALPLAYFDFDIRSTCDRPVKVQILASARNAAAYDQPGRIYVNRRIRDGRFSAMELTSGQTDPDNPTTGATCLAAFDESSTAYMGWDHHHPYYERLLRDYPLPETDESAGSNSADPQTGVRQARPRCFATIGRAAELSGRGAALKHTFAFTWNFPNLYGRDPKHLKGKNCDEPIGHERFEGHYYNRFFDSAEAVARYALAERDRLLAETEAFHRAFFDSSLSGCVLDQVNSHLNTFRTNAWLTKTGMYGLLEGISPVRPFAGIDTTDVSMYAQIAASLLFPELDRMTVDIWRKYQQPSGCVIHWVSCNSYEPNDLEVDGHRLDLPAQFAFMTLRSAFWSGDSGRLAEVWPSVKSALAYVLRERDKNGDRLPDMEGVMCSYDNFPMFGVSPYIVTQWLAAVALALKAARSLGDRVFEAEYGPYFEQGRATLETTTWNGRYFNLCSDDNPNDPQGRLGCMVDQLVGYGAAFQLGLPPVVDPDKAATAMRTILDMNYKPEQGLRNCQWPGDNFLHEIHKDVWVDQANTCWTGVELAFAAQLYYAGMNDSAEMLIRNVDERYRRWGLYWDHQEFGGHYYRPMSALGIPNAFLGLRFDGETLRIAPARPLPAGRWLVLLPGAYGTFHRDAGGCRLEIRGGRCLVRTIELPAAGSVQTSGMDAPQAAEPAGEQATRIRFEHPVPLECGAVVAVCPAGDKESK